MKSVTTALLSIASVLTLLCTQPAQAEKKKFEADISSAKIEVSSNEFTSKEEEVIEHLKKAMKEYYIVSKDDWTHKYTHIASADATGTITWTEDKTKSWSWLVRPGGLASVTDEKGLTIYLAKIVN